MEEWREGGLSEEKQRELKELSERYDKSVKESNEESNELKERINKRVEKKRAEREGMLKKNKEEEK